jgi:hypothetical protein
MRDNAAKARPHGHLTSFASPTHRPRISLKDLEAQAGEKIRYILSSIQRRAMIHPLLNTAPCDGCPRMMGALSISLAMIVNLSFRDTPYSCDILCDSRR